MENVLIIFYHPNPYNTFIKRRIGYYNGKKLGFDVEKGLFIQRLSPSNDKPVDKIRYCFCNKITSILRKQESQALGYPNSLYGFAGYDDNYINSFEEMNITEDDFVDIPENCFDYSMSFGYLFDTTCPFIDMEKVKNTTNIKLNYIF